MSWKLATLDEIKSLAVGDKVKVNGTETTVHSIYDRNSGDYGFNTVEEFRKQAGHYSQIVGWYGEQGVEGYIEIYVWNEESIPFGKQLFGYKIKVKDEEQSRLIQEAVFEAGGSWRYRDKTLDLRSKFLWIATDGEITHLPDNDEEFFNKEKTPELTLETVKSLRIVETVPVKSQADIDKENLQKVIDRLQEDLDNAKQQLNNIGGN